MAAILSSLQRTVIAGFVLLLVIFVVVGALRVSAARQVNQNGVWADAPVAAATVQKLEDIILTRARDLRRVAVR